MKKIAERIAILGVVGEGREEENEVEEDKSDMPSYLGDGEFAMGLPPVNSDSDLSLGVALPFLPDGLVKIFTSLTGIFENRGYSDSICSLEVTKGTLAYRQVTKDMMANKEVEEEVIDMDIIDGGEFTGESTYYDEYHENEKVNVSVNEQAGEMATEVNRLKRMKEVKIISSELAEKRVNDHQVEVLSSDQAGRMEIERKILEGMQEGEIMVRRNNAKKEVSDERRTSKSEKFERIFNF